MAMQRSFLASLVALAAFAALLLPHMPLLVAGDPVPDSYSYGVPGCVVATSIDSSSHVRFALTLSRALVSGESLTFDLGPSGTPAGITYAKKATGTCLASSQALTILGTNFVGPSGAVVYSVPTIIGSSPGCAFVADRTTPLPITFQGFLLITFTSSTAVQAVYFGQVNVVQTSSISNSPTTYTTTITPVVQGTVTIADQQLTGVVYRFGAPTDPPPLMATPNAYMALTFQVTSDLPFHYWFADLSAQLCPTSSSGCVDLYASYYNGASPPQLDVPLPTGQTSTTGISFGLASGGSAANNNISFWIHVPPTAATMCPAVADGVTPSCSITCVLTLDVDASSVTAAHHRQMILSAHLHHDGTDSSNHALRTLADTSTTTTSLAAGASITLVSVPVNGVTSDALPRVAARPQLWLATCAALAFLASLAR